MMDYHVRRLMINEPYIDAICQKFSLTPYHVEEVKRLYYKALEKYLTQGRKLELSIGALIYYVRKRDKMPIEMKLISEKLNLDIKLLFKTYKKMKRELGLLFRK